MAQITVKMGDGSTRTYDGEVEILEGGVLKVTPDEEQYPIVFLSPQIVWLEATQEQGKSATPKVF
jgi:hypothetical protein